MNPKTENPYRIGEILHFLPEELSELGSDLITPLASKWQPRSFNEVLRGR
jgi:hypothetical protein